MNWPRPKRSVTMLRAVFLRGYRRVNALFARRLAPLLRPDDIVWVHDYHLIPLADELLLGLGTLLLANWKKRKEPDPIDATRDVPR